MFEISTEMNCNNRKINDCLIFCVVFFSHAESAESYEAQSDEKLGSGRFCEFCEFCVKLLSTFFLRENDKLICLIGKYTLLLRRQA